MLKQTK